MPSLPKNDSVFNNLEIPLKESEGSHFIVDKRKFLFYNALAAEFTQEVPRCPVHVIPKAAVPNTEGSMK